jgi:hypothetical protein
MPSTSERYLPWVWDSVNAAHIDIVSQLSTKTVQPKPVSSYSVGRRRKYNLRSHTTVEMILTRNESYGRHGPSRFRSGVLWHASMMQSEGDERDISFLTLIHR